MTYAALGAFVIRTVIACVGAGEVAIVAVEWLVVETMLHATPAGLWHS